MTIANTNLFDSDQKSEQTFKYYTTTKKDDIYNSLKCSIRG